MWPYYLGWAIIFLPFLGAAASFLCETPRRAVQTVLSFNVLALFTAIVVFGFRLIHRHDQVFDNFFNWWQVNAQAGKTSEAFAANFQPELGIRIDALGAAFCVVILLIAVVVLWHAMTFLRGDEGYRRAFWIASLLVFGAVALVLSPNLFQTWIGWEIVGLGTFALAINRWDDNAIVAKAKRAFVLLRIADVALLLGLVVTYIRLGSDASAQTPLGNNSISDPFDFNVLQGEVLRAANRVMVGVGGRTLIVLGLLFAIAALVRAAQAPLSGWLTDVAEAPLPGLVLLLSVVPATGIILLAKLWPLMLAVPNLLSIVAIFGAATAVIAAVLACVQTEMSRFIVWISTAQIGLIVIAVGVGAYSPALQMLFIFLIFNAVLILGSGNVVRAYRTQELAEMGGVWRTLPTTAKALGLWVLAVSGLNLSSYEVLSGAWRNTFSDQVATPGHVSQLIQVIAVAASLITTVVIAFAAARFWLQVCGGEPVKRRGFVVERLRDVESRLNKTLIVVLAVGVAAILCGIPAAFKGFTFSHFVFYGDPHTQKPQNLSVVGPAVAMALVAGVIGLGGTWLTRTRSQLRFFAADVATKLQDRVAYTFDWATSGLGSLLGRVDDEVLEGVGNSAGAGTAVVADGARQLRTTKVQRQLIVAITIGAVTIVVALLYASGRLGAH